MADSSFGGPWNMEPLRATPSFTIEPGDGLREIYFAGEPFKDQPTRVFGYYAAPKEHNGKAPAMVLVHGGGGTAFAEWVELWTARGYAALSMDLAGCGPNCERLPDGGPGQDEDSKFSAIRDGVRAAWPYHAVAAVVRAHSVLAAQPEVDPDCIGITGISWGGYLTCIVAGLDDGLKFAVPVYGCGFLHDNSAWLPTFAKMPEDDRALWIETFDPSRYLRDARLPMLWLNGTNDAAYPLDSYRKSYRLPPGPRSLCVTVRMPHGHEPGWAPVEIGLFADHHLCGGPPLPSIGPARLEGSESDARLCAEVSPEAGQPMLHYTEQTGAWIDRDWQSVPADVDGHRVSAALPAQRPLVAFLTITDSRAATVSTEHLELS